MLAQAHLDIGYSLLVVGYSKGAEVEEKYGVLTPKK
jgi:hypothetical protein